MRHFFCQVDHFLISWTLGRFMGLKYNLKNLNLILNLGNNIQNAPRIVWMISRTFHHNVDDGNWSWTLHIRGKASGVTLSSRIACCNACEHSSSSRSWDIGRPTSVTTACNTLSAKSTAVWESCWMSAYMFGNPNETSIMIPTLN